MYSKKIGKYSYNNNYIGQGSFSKVYKGLDDKNNNYAIKKIYKKNDIKYLNLIEKEIEIMKKLNHKNIVKLYDEIYTEKYIYLIMELCDNDLNTYIHNNDLSENIIKNIMKQLIEVLKYIMDNNIVHRDLKPHNILINKDNTLKLADFGFAKEFKETLLTNTICGSPLYMAPELLNNDKYNIKSDLWSVGVILYEMVMKEHPFKALNINELTNVVNKNKVLFLNVNINSGCKDLIEKLLIVDSNNRLEWDELYKNSWIYDNTETNIETNTETNIETNTETNIEKNTETNTEINKLKEDINILIKKEDSFDYCFENSITDIISIKNNTIFDDKLNNEIIYNLNNKQTINLNNLIIHNYIKI